MVILETVLNAAMEVKARVATMGPPLAPSPEKGSIAESVLKQFKDEVGPEPIAMEKDLQLRQKFGVVPPQLTLSETNLIRREERNESRG